MLKHIFLLLLGIACSAQAKVKQDGDIIYYQGQLNQADNQRVEELLSYDTGLITRLVITSGGGNVDLGMDLAEIVRKNHLDVEVPKFCFSSCANYVFMAGDVKLLGKDAILGWHGDAASAKWSDEDIRDMLKDTPEQNNPEAFTQLRAEYDQRVVTSHNREVALYQAWGIDHKLLTMGHAPGLVQQAREHGYRGWTFTLSSLKLLGVKGLDYTDWQPKQNSSFPLLILDLSA